jgi:hypothetical protein
MLARLDRTAVSPARDGIGSNARWPDVGRPGFKHTRLGDGVRPHASAGEKHDPAHRPAADALDAAHKLRTSRPAAASVVPHPGDDLADRQIVPPLVRLIDRLWLPAALAGHAQEP